MHEDTTPQVTLLDMLIYVSLVFFMFFCFNDHFGGQLYMCFTYDNVDTNCKHRGKKGVTCNKGPKLNLHQGHWDHRKCILNLQVNARIPQSLYLKVLTSFYATHFH